jgi:hypothetical protein
MNDCRKKTTESLFVRAFERDSCGCSSHAFDRVSQASRRVFHSDEVRCSLQAAGGKGAKDGKGAIVGSGAVEEANFPESRHNVKENVENEYASTEDMEVPYMPSSA